MTIEESVKNKVESIRKILQDTNAKGLIYGNSGGKDSALVSILCRMATENVLGLIMPCGVSLKSDENDAMELARTYDIKQQVVDLTKTKQILLESIKEKISDESQRNISPRLRMTTLYAVAQTKGYLVVGTTNKSEALIGYFTKWGDGGCDFNPIHDLTSDEVYEYLEYLNRIKPIPKGILSKPPSAGLYEGQTDESDLGVTYKAINNYLKGLKVEEKEKEVIEKHIKRNEHKKRMPFPFPEIK